MIGFTAPAEANGYGRGECRDYTRTYREYGHQRVSYGTACRDHDGIWRVVAEQNYPPYGLNNTVVLIGDRAPIKVYYPTRNRRYYDNQYSQGSFFYYNRGYDRRDHHDRYDDRRNWRRDRD